MDALKVTVMGIGLCSVKTAILFQFNNAMHKKCGFPSQKRLSRNK